jgi:hypothetical protein
VQQDAFRSGDLVAAPCLKKYLPVPRLPTLASVEVRDGGRVPEPGQASAQELAAEEPGAVGPVVPKERSQVQEAASAVQMAN